MIPVLLHKTQFHLATANNSMILSQSRISPNPPGSRIGYLLIHLYHTIHHRPHISPIPWILPQPICWTPYSPTCRRTAKSTSPTRMTSRYRLWAMLRAYTKMQDVEGNLSLAVICGVKANNLFQHVALQWHWVPREGSYLSRIFSCKLSWFIRISLRNYR